MNTNYNPNKKQCESQCVRILRWLNEGHTLTALEALNRFDCMTLHARITDLRQSGHNIATKMILLPSGKRVAEYSLVMEGGAE